MCSFTSPDSDAAAQLRAAFARSADLPDDAWDAVAGSIAVVDAARGESLFAAGAVVDRLYLLLGGVVRLCTTECDREVTLGFERDGRFVTDLESFLRGEPARMSAIALEDVRAVAIQASVLHAAYDAHPVWERIGRQAMERVVLHKIDKERRIRTLSAEQRYQAMCESDSWLLRRVPQYHIAAYLGITPETLSRIRARS